MNAQLERARKEIDSAVEGMPPEQLEASRDGKWSAAQILEHLSLAFGGTAKGLHKIIASGQTRASSPSLRDRAICAVVLGLGYVPKGRQAPEYTRPRGLSGEAALNAIRNNLQELDTALAECEKRFGSHVKINNHPLMGPFTVEEWRRFHFVHTRHHMRQIRALRTRQQQSAAARGA